MSNYSGSSSSAVEKTSRNHNTELSFVSNLSSKFNHLSFLIFHLWHFFLFSIFVYSSFHFESISLCWVWISSKIFFSKDFIHFNTNLSFCFLYFIRKVMYFFDHFFFSFSITQVNSLRWWTLHK